MTDSIHLSLGVDDADARERIRAAVDALLEQPRPAPQLIVSLDGEALPSPFVAELVTGLRRLREVGGALAVEALTPQLGDAMALYGLDRVFALPLDPEKVTPRRGRPWVRRTAVAALALLVSAFACRPAPSSAQTGPDPADPAAIIARVVERNPNLSSFEGRLHVAFRLISFPFVREHLDATTYYKRPSNYEVVFDKVPSYARGFERLYTDIGDPSNWEARFVITPAGEEPFEHHQDLALRLVQRVRGMIDHETVLIDPDNWTIDQIRYQYYNGGTITMSQSFRAVGGYLLLASQRADIAIPHVRAVAYGTYDGYRTNVAVDDTVFGRTQ
jgi:hypothetical protein